MVHNSDIDTCTRAIIERIFYHKEGDNFVMPQRPSMRHVNSQLREFKYRIVGMLEGRVPTLSLEESLQRCPAHARKLYQRAYESFRFDPINQKDAHIKSFIKIEKTMRLDKSDPTARVVSPRGPRYNLVLGKYLRNMEKRIYKAIDTVFGHTVVSKGMNPRQTAACIYEHLHAVPNCVVVGMDASRFDQHVSKSMLKWEHSVYNSIIRDPELVELLSWQVENQCQMRVEDEVIKYTTQGTRCSGDLNTSLGNTLIMCAVTYAYLTRQGLTANVHYRLFNAGDDQLIFIDEAYLHRLNDLPNYFVGMGFPMELEKPVKTLEEIEFCSTKPVYSASGLSMCRIWKNAIYKDLTCNVTVKNSYMLKQWMSAVSDCGIASAGDYPIYGALYKKYKAVSGGVNYKNLLNQSSMRGSLLEMRTANMTGMEPTFLSRCSFEKAFGITISEQRFIENLILKADWSTEIVGNDHAYFDSRGLQGVNDIYFAHKQLLNVILNHPFPSEQAAIPRINSQRYKHGRYS